MEISKVQTLIQQGFPDARVEVSGDGRHFEALVVSAEFEGLPLLRRHKLVLATVKAEIASDELHALSIKAKTPAEIDA